MFNLCTRDEYNQVSIVGTGTDQEMIALARKEVHAENMDNALSSEEQCRTWTACLVEVVSNGETVENAHYAGKNSRGEEVVLYADVNDSQIGEWKQAFASAMPGFQHDLPDE